VAVHLGEAPERAEALLLLGRRLLLGVHDGLAVLTVLALRRRERALGMRSAVKGRRVSVGSLHPVAGGRVREGDVGRGLGRLNHRRHLRPSMRCGGVRWAVERAVWGGRMQLLDGWSRSLGSFASGAHGHGHGHVSNGLDAL
jgi:hypothetical protein